MTGEVEQRPNPLVMVDSASFCAADSGGDILAHGTASLVEVLPWGSWGFGLFLRKKGDEQIISFRKAMQHFKSQSHGIKCRRGNGGWTGEVERRPQPSKMVDCALFCAADCGADISVRG